MRQVYFLNVFFCLYTDTTMNKAPEPISWKLKLIASRANYVIFVVFEKYGDRKCSWLYQNH